MSDKIISIKKYQKNKRSPQMLFLFIIAGIAAGLLSWHYFVENKSKLDVEIPQSKNLFYNDQKPIATTATQIADDFEQYEGKPVLLYLYTTWCGVCKKNLPIFNEIAREFQNTDLKVIAIAIDRDLTEQALMAQLEPFGNIYYYPKYLAFKEGFVDLLKQKGINYQGKIPYTVLISKEGKVVMKYVGVKKQAYLRNKIIAELYN